MLDKLKLHRKIAEEMKRGSEQLRTWIEGERNPWLDVYTPGQIIDIANLAGISNEKRIVHLSSLLGNIAHHFLELKVIVNLDQTPTEKKIWLESHIVKPAAKLINALNLSNDRFFSEKYFSIEPEYIDSRESLLILRETKFAPVGRSNRVKLIEVSSAPDDNHAPLRERLAKDLRDLVRWVDKKKESFDKKGKKKHRTRYREELVFVLMKLYIHLNPSASVTQQTHGVKPKGSSSSKTGQFAEFVRRAAAPILQRHENLDDQMKVAIRRLKQMKKSSPYLGSIFSINLD